MRGAAAAQAEETAGQLLLIGLPGPELDPEAQSLLNEIRPLGVILFRRNIAGTRELCELTRAISDGRERFLMAIDHEGGRVHRMPPEFTHFPPALAMARYGDPGLLCDVGHAHAAELRAAGFNLNFAPVLDVHTNAANPIIGDRAFGATPEEVIHHALPYLQGLTEGGMLGCGKHFPGHGDTDLDSHLALPTLPAATHGLDRLRGLEFRPFARAIAQGVASIMTAHIICEALDPVLPATLSKAVIRDCLRGELGYRGFVISDDLEMKAIADNFRVGGAAVQAITAECDACLVCATPALIREAHTDLSRAIADGVISAALVDAIGKRRDKLFSKLRKLERVAVDPLAIGAPAHRALAERLRVRDHGEHVA